MHIQWVSLGFFTRLLNHELDQSLATTPKQGVTIRGVFFILIFLTPFLAGSKLVIKEPGYISCYK